MLAHALKNLVRSPVIWLIGLAAASADFWAVFNYSPNNTRISLPFILFCALGWLAEAILVFLLAARIQARTLRRGDAFLAGIMAFPRIVGMKAFLLLAPITFIAILSMLFSIFRYFNRILLIALVPILIVLWIIQMVSFFALCTILVQDTSTGEAISTGWWLTWSKKGKNLLISLPFLLIDLAILGGLIGMQAITLNSAFGYVVTQESTEFENQLTDLNRSLNTNFSTQGDYVVINRPLNGVWAALLHNRNVDLLSLSLFVMQDVRFGFAVAIIAWLLLLVRTAVWVQVYMKSMESQLKPMASLL